MIDRAEFAVASVILLAGLNAADALWCYSCVGTHPGCGEVFDFRWHWSKVCDRYDDKCVKIIEKKQGSTLITRGCLSEFEHFRRDIPADHYEGCRPAARDKKLGHYVNNTISELDVDRTFYDEVTFCFCDFDERCNSGVSVSPSVAGVLAAVAAFFLVRR